MTFDTTMALIGFFLLFVVLVLVVGLYIPACRKNARKHYPDEEVEKVIAEHICSTIGGIGILGSNASFVRFSLYPEKITVVFSQLGRRKRIDIDLAEVLEFECLRFFVFRPAKLKHTNESLSSPIFLLSAPPNFEQAVREAIAR